MADLIFASHNENKSREIRQLLPDFQLASLKDLAFNEEIPETGDTLEANAAIKADRIFAEYHKPVFADDTGLIVPALDGAPGVYSARYAGPEANAQANMTKLLKELESKEDRYAYFETVICYIEASGEKHFFSGKVEGHILESQQGEKGFGYDPVFCPKGEPLSFAEMSPEAKNAISHRGRALQAFIRFLQPD
ncbi:RdgB/HAM1 family non-canonical purine NTP pyrophosphatase [Croceimicrobium sp.]|uniref:RdgB/HAM1 family non-canonical purine NTP pyrophosphatase n=1 Tax=Croceimicrobium sp. TaxID=2828340 RepID=UPI003BA85B0D